MKFEKFNNKPREKSYYEILGISTDATPEEIKKAYRRIAKKTHPDQVGDESRKDEFLAAKEAYSVLSDEKKRAQYDHDNSIKKEKNDKETRKMSEDENFEEFFEEFMDSIKGDKDMSMMLLLSRGKPELEKRFQEYIQSAFKLYKEKKGYDKKIQELQRKHKKRAQELQRRREELKRREEELKGGGRDFQSQSNYAKTRENKNIKNLTGDLGVEKDILGYERLVDIKTGRQIGYSSFKSIEYVSGIIIATDSIGYKRILNRDGDSSYETFKDIIIRDGLVIGKDSIGNEKLIDKNTGKTIGYRSYKKIIKEGGKIYGINVIGRKEEIKY